MEKILGEASPMRHFGQIDLIHDQLSLQRKDFFRLLTATLGGLSQAPVSVRAAVEGMCYSLPALLGNSTANLELLNEISLLKVDVAKIELPPLPHFNLRRKRAKWIKWQLFEYVHLLVNSQKNPDLKYVGIYLSCLLKGVKHNRRIPSILFKYLKDGLQRLSEEELRSIHRMELNAKQFLADVHGNLTESYAEKVTFYFQNKIYYADSKTRQSVYDRKTYSPSEFEAICHQLKNASNHSELSKSACLTLIAMLTNLPLSYVYEIPILENTTDEWVIALSTTEWILYFDLSIIGPGGVNLVDEQFVPASRILVKPVPLFLAKALQEHLSKASETIKTIGEVFGLRLRDITFYSNHVEIHINSGKTYAAKRTLEIKDKSLLDALSAMVERRKLEMASPSDFLFGDPAKPTRLYRLGHFYWGLNQLLKQATGDQKISFHSLSDSVISNELIKSLSGKDTGFKNDLNQLATDFGHQSVITSCSSYMHLHHLSIRTCMDRALKTVTITSAIASQWSKKSAEAMRKQISLKRLDSNEYYWNGIFTLPINSDAFECCGAEFETQEPIVPEFLQKNPETHFYKILLIIKDLAEGMLIPSIASRHSVDEKFIRQVLNVLNGLLSEMRFITANYSQSLIGMQTSAQRLKEFGFDLDRTEQAKLKGLIQFLKNRKSPIDEDTKQAVLAWLQLCDKKHYQVINTELETFKLIHFLKNTGVQETHIAVYISEGSEGDACVLMIKKLFLMVYSIPPAIFRVKLRRDRPSIYLSLTEQLVSIESEPYGAANCMSGFRAIMLSLAVMLKMEPDHE